MKKLIVSAAIVLGSLSTIAATAATINPSSQSVSIADEYTEIKKEEVPAAVMEALKKGYPDAVLTKAFINEKKEYKLEIAVKDQKTTVYADVDGKWIQK
jgi:hypothetical protein